MVEPKNEFEIQIVKLCAEIADMLIEKNRMYDDSYRSMRNLARTDPGIKNAKAPFWLHILEKIRRYMNQSEGDMEDPLKDGAGYFILEAVCRRLDDQNL